MVASVPPAVATSTGQLCLDAGGCRCRKTVCGTGNPAG